MNHTDKHSIETTLEPNESAKKEELSLSFQSEQEKNEQISEVTNKNHIIRKRKLGEASEMVNADEDLDVLNKRQAIQKEEQSISSSAEQGDTSNQIQGKSGDPAEDFKQAKEKYQNDKQQALESPEMHHQIDYTYQTFLNELKIKTRSSLLFANIIREGGHMDLQYVKAFCNFLDTHLNEITYKTNDGYIIRIEGANGESFTYSSGSKESPKEIKIVHQDEHFNAKNSQDQIIQSLSEGYDCLLDALKQRVPEIQDLCNKFLREKIADCIENDEVIREEICNGKHTVGLSLTLYGGLTKSTKKWTEKPENVDVRIPKRKTNKLHLKEAYLEARKRLNLIWSRYRKTVFLQKFLEGRVNKDELWEAIVSVLKYGLNVQELENEIDRLINDSLKSKALTNKMLPSLEKGVSNQKIKNILVSFFGNHELNVKNVEFSAENATFDVNKLSDSICDFINNQQPFKIPDEEFKVTKYIQKSSVYMPVQWEAKVMIEVNNTRIQFIAEINLDNPTNPNLYPCLPSDAHFGFEFKYKSDKDCTEEKNSALKGIPKIKGHVIMEEIERRDSIPKRTREEAIASEDILIGALICDDDWIVTGNRKPHEKSDKNANRIENPEQREISPSV